MKSVAQLPGVDPKAFRCCFCCHVKTGTLIYGIFMALAEITLLGLLVLAAIRPEVLVTNNQQPYDGIIFVQNGEGEAFKDIHAEFRDQRATYDNTYLLFAVTLICLFSSLALVYGVARNRASYVLPAFCLQVFDFCLTCLSVVGGFTYVSNIKEWLYQQRLTELPGMNHVMCLNAEYLTLLVVLGLIIVLSVKIYLIGMVWACYKYIQLYVASRGLVREFAVHPDNEQMLLPPRYEDVIKTSPTGPLPPAYSSE